MATRYGPTSRRRPVALLVMTLASLGVPLSGPAESIGGTCNGRLATSPSLDASRQHGPVTLFGTDGNDVLIGSKGDDAIFGYGGDDVICGGGGGDELSGGDGGDVIFGEAGADHIRGIDGDDVLVGNDDGTDEDDLDGGDGHNDCILGPNDESDC